MLGVINLAIKSLVITKFGADVWLKILTAANLLHRSISSTQSESASSSSSSSSSAADNQQNQQSTPGSGKSTANGGGVVPGGGGGGGEWQRGEQYDDAETFALVFAAAATLGVRPADVMVLFGRYWLEQQETDTTFRKILATSGSTFLQFLQNVNRVHSLCSEVTPMKSPMFKILSVTKQDATTTMILQYSPGARTRQGLTPLVTGLLEGAASRFSAVSNLKVYSREMNGEETIEFMVLWDEAQNDTPSCSGPPGLDDELILSFMRSEGFIQHDQKGISPSHSIPSRLASVPASRSHSPPSTATTAAPTLSLSAPLTTSSASQPPQHGANTSPNQATSPAIVASPTNTSLATTSPPVQVVTPTPLHHSSLRGNQTTTTTTATATTSTQSQPQSHRTHPPQSQSPRSTASRSPQPPGGSRSPNPTISRSPPTVSRSPPQVNSGSNPKSPPLATKSAKSPPAVTHIPPLSLKHTPTTQHQSPQHKNTKASKVCLLQ
ncbi:hypothetical protein Pelo_332 [Pelomyxa schiedti]|nr:hypothetical protein Pelo_332 [Pelomyxa schiedti]